VQSSWVLVVATLVGCTCTPGALTVDPQPAPAKEVRLGQLVLGEALLPLDGPPRLEKGVPFLDPHYGVEVVRVTDRGRDRYADTGIKHEYARSDPENADGTRLVLRGNEGTWYLYDAGSLRLLRRLRLGEGGQEPEPRWDARDPHLLYHLSGMKLMTLDVESGRQAVVHDFSADFPDGTYVMTGSEGDASVDRRRFCFMVKRVEGSDWKPKHVFAFDRTKGLILGRLDQLPDTIDWVSMDMSGRHCVIGWDNRPAGAYAPDLRREVALPGGARGHADLALTLDGKDVLVFQDVKRDFISMADLDSGREVDLLHIPFRVNTDIGLHFSGNAARVPGWVLVSTYGAKNPPAGRRHSWMDLQIFMLELRALPAARVWRVAAARSYTFINPDEGEKAYFAEPYAAINTRGTRVYWGSNWGQRALTRTELFRAELPADWTRQLRAR
jgi:hypothetical protein